MLVLSWNARGLGRGEKRRLVKNLVALHKPILLFIQESKLGLFNKQEMRPLGGTILAKGVGMEAIGSARGIISLRNDSLFKVTSCITNQNCIIWLVNWWLSRKQLCFAMFCNVYTPNVEGDRKVL